MSCKRSGCHFKNNGYEYCCYSCSQGRGHGNNCTGKTQTAYVPQQAVQGQEQCRVPGCRNALFEPQSRGCGRSHHQQAVQYNYPQK